MCRARSGRNRLIMWYFAFYIVKLGNSHGPEIRTWILHDQKPGFMFYCIVLNTNTCYIANRILVLIPNLKFNLSQVILCFYILRSTFLISSCLDGWSTGMNTTISHKVETHNLPKCHSHQHYNQRLIIGYFYGEGHGEGGQRCVAMELRGLAWPHLSPHMPLFERKWEGKHVV